MKQSQLLYHVWLHSKHLQEQGIGDFRMSDQPLTQEKAYDNIRISNTYTGKHSADYYYYVLPANQ